MPMKIRCQRDLGELKRIVRSTSEFFERKNIDDSIRHAVDLVIEELFVNMVRYNTESDEMIEIEVEAIDGGISATISDFDVEHFDPTRAGVVDTGLPLEDRTPGGLGIFLVLKMVDSISYDYQNRVSRITFTKCVESGADV